MNRYRDPWNRLLQKERLSLRDRSSVGSSELDGHEIQPWSASPEIGLVPETSPEDFHSSRKGEPARGSFLKLDTSYRIGEPEWDFGNIAVELEPDVTGAGSAASIAKLRKSPARRRVGGSPTGSPSSFLLYAIKRVGRLALEMNWLTADTRSALDALKDRSKVLSQNERLALHILLGRCAEIRRFQSDVDLILRTLEVKLGQSVISPSGRR